MKEDPGRQEVQYGFRVEIIALISRENKGNRLSREQWNHNLKGLVVNWDRALKHIFRSHLKARGAHHYFQLSGAGTHVVMVHLGVFFTRLSWGFKEECLVLSLLKTGSATPILMSFVPGSCGTWVLTGWLRLCTPIFYWVCTPSCVLQSFVRLMATAFCNKGW